MTQICTDLKGESRAAIPGSNQGTAERPGSDEGRLQTGLGEAAFVFWKQGKAAPEVEN
jgi:hypothetical protein